MTYAEKLKDPRWQIRRHEIIKEANGMCEDAGCGRFGIPLDIHHIWYFSDRDPWDYERVFLMALCRECHFKRQLLEETIHVNLAKLLRDIPICRMDKIAWELISAAMRGELADQP